MTTLQFSPINLFWTQTNWFSFIGVGRTCLNDEEIIFTLPYNESIPIAFENKLNSYKFSYKFSIILPKSFPKLFCKPITTLLHRLPSFMQFRLLFCVNIQMLFHSCFTRKFSIWILEKYTLLYTSLLLKWGYEFFSLY